jgi:uncharacterized membrane protein
MEKYPNVVQRVQPDREQGSRIGFAGVLMLGPAVPLLAGRKMAAAEK